MSVKVRVRGIYATALSAVFLQSGLSLVEPSPVIQARFNLASSAGVPEVTVVDRPDRQGIVIEGLREAVSAVAAVVRRACPEAVVFVQHPSHKPGSPWSALTALMARLEVEFPSVAKQRLDEVRASIVPTLPGHHYLKVLAPEAVDQAENANPDPEALAQRALALKQELVYKAYMPGKEVSVVHVKAGSGGFVYRATVEERRADGTLVLQRAFRPGGTYDGLGLPKQAGDYGRVELWEDRWWGRRAYFRSDGTPLGELYNVHTPPELYPDEVRYLDLEVDVVRRMDGAVEVLDREVLERKVQEGLLPPALAERALHEAEKLAKILRDEVPKG